VNRVAAGAAAGIAGGALLIAVISVLARVVGFGRQLTFQGSVSETQLGAVYQTANTLPNVAFEIVAGGALASIVVPLLAAAAMRGDTAHVRQVTSAFLGWTLVVLVPVALLGVLLAGPVMELALRGEGGQPGIDLGRRMLLIFLPQIPLYGIAVVTAGVLQAHRRFLAAALAPVLSSVVVATAFLVFRQTFLGDRDVLPTVTARDEWILAGGTTLGVVALAAATLVPMLARVTSIKPTLRFPPGEAAHARGLAGAGLATLGAQQVAFVTAMVMANQEGPDGAWVTYLNSWMVYLLPYAVLAVPIATAAFPRLSEYALKTQRTEHDAYARTLAASTQGVLIVSVAGAAALIAAAWPIARFFAVLSQAEVAPSRMAWALIAFAPGLLGYGLVAHLGRALFARRRGSAAAIAIVSGWLTAATVAAVAAQVVPAERVVAGLGLAHTIGMTVAGLLLARAVLADSGRRALGGVGRVLGIALLGGLAGGAAGFAVAAVLPSEPVAGIIGAGLLAALVAAVGVAAALWLTSRDDVRAVFRP
jgi:peptidoglycan biosynthesis protein MviN/MurJ (putative lipid II flippase)